MKTALTAVFFLILFLALFAALILFLNTPVTSLWGV